MSDTDSARITSEIISMTSSGTRFSSAAAPCTVGSDARVRLVARMRGSDTTKRAPRPLPLSAQMRPSCQVAMLRADRQPQAGAAVAAHVGAVDLVEALEDRVQLVVAGSRARRPRPTSRTDDVSRSSPISIRAVRFRELHGVLEQVHDELLEQVRIRVDVRRLAVRQPRSSIARVSRRSGG